MSSGPPKDSSSSSPQDSSSSSPQVLSGDWAWRVNLHPGNCCCLRLVAPPVSQGTWVREMMPKAEPFLPVLGSWELCLPI